MDDALRFILTESRMKYDWAWMKYVAQLGGKKPIAIKMELSMERLAELNTPRDGSDTQRTEIKTKRNFPSQIIIDSHVLIREELQHSVNLTKKILKRNESSVIPKEKEGNHHSNGVEALVSPKLQNKNLRAAREARSSKPTVSYQVFGVAELPLLSPTRHASYGHHEDLPNDLNMKKSKPQFEISPILPAQTEEDGPKLAQRGEEEVFQKKFKYLKKQSHLRGQTENPGPDSALPKNLRLPPLTNFPELRERSVPNLKDVFETEEVVERIGKPANIVAVKPINVQPEQIHSAQSRISTEVIVSPKTNVYSIIGKVRYKIQMHESVQKQEEQIEKIYNRLLEANSQIRKEREQCFEIYYQKHPDQKPTKARRQKFGLKSITKQISKTTTAASRGPEVNNNSPTVPSKQVEKKTEQLRKLFYTPNETSNNAGNNENPQNEDPAERLLAIGEEVRFDSYLSASLEGLLSPVETDKILLENQGSEN